MRIVRSVALLAAVAVVAAIGLAPAAGQAQSPEREVIVDRIVARVNNDIITQSDVARMLPIYIQVMGPADRNVLRTAAGREQVAKDMIQFLIDAELLEAKARDAGMAMTESDVDLYLANYQRQLDMSESQFRAALEQEGIDYDDYREFMQKYLTQIQMMRAEGLSDVTVTAAEVQERMDREFPEGLEETYLRSSHVFLDLEPDASPEQVEAARSRLIAARARIVSGEATFEEVARELNEDSTAARGGQLAAFPIADLDEAYSRPALALDEGEISEPVRTSRGMHLIRLDGVEHRATANADRVRERIRYEIQQQRSEQRKETYLRRLRRAAFIEVLVDDFNL